MTLIFVWPWPWPFQSLFHFIPNLYSNFWAKRSLSLATAEKRLSWPWPLYDLDLDLFNWFCTPSPPYIPIVVHRVCMFYRYRQEALVTLTFAWPWPWPLQRFHNNAPTIQWIFGSHLLVIVSLLVTLFQTFDTDYSPNEYSYLHVSVRSVTHVSRSLPA